VSADPPTWFLGAAGGGGRRGDPAAGGAAAAAGWREVGVGRGSWLAEATTGQQRSPTSFGLQCRGEEE
jgi:hypothetical protein